MTVVKGAKSKLLAKRAIIYPFRRIFAWRRILFVARVAFDLRFFSHDEREGWKIVYREENFWYLINNRYIIPARNAVTARIALLVYRYIWYVYVYVTGWIGHVGRSGQGLLTLAPAGMVTTVIDWYERGARWNGKETKRKKKENADAYPRRYFLSEMLWEQIGGKAGRVDRIASTHNNVSPWIAHTPSDDFVLLLPDGTSTQLQKRKKFSASERFR